MFLNHDVNNITNGDHASHRTFLYNRNVTEILFYHEFHDVKDAVLGGNGEEIGGRGHDFRNLGVGRLTAFDNHLGKVICNRDSEFGEIGE